MIEPFDHNPYAPPAEDILHSSGLQEADRLKLGRNSIRRTSALAVCSGLLFLSFSYFLPEILRWQAETMLRPYGAEQHAGNVVSAELERIGYARMWTGALGGLAIVAAGLLRFRRALGLYLLMVVCAAFICEGVVAIAQASGVPPAAVIRAGWWALLFASAYSTKKWI